MSHKQETKKRLARETVILIAEDFYRDKVTYQVIATKR
jgi:hypothetical protein